MKNTDYDYDYDEDDDNDYDEAFAEFMAGNKKVEGHHRLLKVADGLLDEIFENSIDETLKSIEDILNYAEDGCGIDLTWKEAEKVQKACQEWRKGTETRKLYGGCDYRDTVIVPLTF